MEVIHNSGLVYNDLKLDNILVGYGEDLPELIGPNPIENCFTDVQLNLIDFGLSSKWVHEETGQHIPEEPAESFKGNILFGSQHQLKYNRTSRRDDLHSLVYLMFFLLNGQTLPGLKTILKMKLNTKQTLEEVCKLKEKHLLTEWCTGRAKPLFSFCLEVQNITFDGEPDYQRLRSILHGLINNGSNVNKKGIYNPNLT